MPLIPPRSGVQREPVSEGLHEAVCYSMIDLGVQTIDYLGQSKNVHQVLLTWELPNERIDIEKEGQAAQNLPRAISKKYTFSMHEKSNLYNDLTAWRGKSFSDAEANSFDLKNVLGKACQLQVIHEVKNGKTYANIKNIVPAPKGTVLKPENPLVYFCIDDQNKAVFPPEIPEWVQKIVIQSETWQKLVNRLSAGPLDDELASAETLEHPEESDDVPF